MIIAEIRGGIGNQLFTYAAAKALALRKGVALGMDLHNHDSHDKRSLAIFSFHIEDTVVSPEIIKILTELPTHRSKQWLINSFDRLFPYYKRSTFIEQNNLFDPNLFKAKSNAYLRGYWQSERYFSSYEAEIRSVLRFKTPVPIVRKWIVDNINTSNSVSIHIRRTDFLDTEGQALYSEITLAYYQRAVTFLKNKVTNPHLFVFSDDIEWTKNHIKFDLPTIFIDPLEGQDFEDLRLMSLCKFHITANSTFSWWGAWLAVFKNKIVIAPGKWFNPKHPTQKDDDLIPKSWVRISN